MNTNKNQGFEEGTLDFSDINQLIDNGVKEVEETLTLEDLNTVEETVLKTEVEDTDDKKADTDEKYLTETPEIKQDVNEELKTSETKAENKSSLDYNSIKNKLIEKGLWEDVTLEIGDEERDLSNIDDLDEETFLAVLEEQNKLKESEIKGSSIEKEGLDDMTLKLIEISKAGGDITDIVKQYDEYVHPLNGLDLNDPKTQEALVINQLKRQGLSDIVIKNSVLEMRDNGTVEESANQIVQNTNKIFNKYLDDKKSQAEEKVKQEQTKRNDFKKGLSEVYKEDYGLETKVANRLVKFGTNDNFLKDKYDEVMSDPKKASELIFFLEDPEAYFKYKNSNRDRSQKINTLKKINIVSKNKDKSSSKSTDDEKKSTKSSFTFEEIKD